MHIISRGRYPVAEPPDNEIMGMYFGILTDISIYHQQHASRRFLQISCLVDVSGSKWFQPGNISEIRSDDSPISQTAEDLLGSTSGSHEMEEILQSKSHCYLVAGNPSPQKNKKYVSSQPNNPSMAKYGHTNKIIVVDI